MWRWWWLFLVESSDGGNVLRSWQSKANIDGELCGVKVVNKAAGAGLWRRGGVIGGCRKIPFCEWKKSFFCAAEFQTSPSPSQNHPSPIPLHFQLTILISNSCIIPVYIQTAKPLSFPTTTTPHNHHHHSTTTKWHHFPNSAIPITSPSIPNSNSTPTFLVQLTKTTSSH